MLKDTKSLGNNKASAWESRGFVIKNEGMHFDTPSSIGFRGTWRIRTAVHGFADR